MVKAVRIIYYSSSFAKSWCKLPVRIQKKAAAAESIFKANNFDPRLKTHRLQGKYQQYYSFSITYSYRIIFEYYQEGVLFIDIGIHGIYQ